MGPWPALVIEWPVYPEDDPMSTVSLKIGPANHGQRMTLAEFHEAEAQEGYLYELARGVLVVTDVPRTWHWQIVDNLHEMFSAYRRAHPGAIVLIGHGSDARYIIPVLESDRHPDLAVVFPGASRMDVPYMKEPFPLPELAVEVVSRGKRARRRDYEEKREEYLAIGVREYWIVDPERRQVTVLSRQDGPSWSERVFQGDEAIVSGLLPGFDATVADVWTGAETE